MSPRDYGRRRKPTWGVAANRDDFDRLVQRGNRRIEIRRTATDTPQAAPIALGAVPDDLHVRVTGTAAVSLTGGHIRVSDAGHIEATATAEVHAYDHATVTAFDDATVIGHHHTRITLCDTSRATAYDHTAIAAWDTTHATAHNDSTVVVATGPNPHQPTIHLTDHAHLYTNTRLTVTGPARTNTTHTPTPFDAAPVDLDY